MCLPGIGQLTRIDFCVKESCVSKCCFSDVRHVEHRKQQITQYQCERIAFRAAGIRRSILDRRTLLTTNWTGDTVSMGGNQSLSHLKPAELKSFVLDQVDGDFTQAFDSIVETLFY